LGDRPILDLNICSSKEEELKEYTRGNFRNVYPAKMLLIILDEITL
jgi:hypothetical protein